MDTFSLILSIIASIISIIAAILGLLNKRELKSIKNSQLAGDKAIQNIGDNACNTISTTRAR